MILTLLSLIYKKKYELAYKISSNHALTEGSEYAAAEWMSGWIALSFLKDPLLAKNHFENVKKSIEGNKLPKIYDIFKKYNNERLSYPVYEEVLLKYGFEN